MNHVEDVAGAVDLGQMCHVRRNVAQRKSQDSNLVAREVACHEFCVMEYSNQLLNHLIRLESDNAVHVTAKPSLTTFQSQPQINHKMRFLIFDFLMCCHTRLGLCNSTLFLCYNILDRYTSKYIVKSCNYQLLALTALWISSKFWDSKNRIAPLKLLVKLCCKQYSAQQFKEMELHLSKSLNWTLCQFATHDSFIDLLLFLKNDTKIPSTILLDNKLSVDRVKFGAMMLCELACFDIELSFNCSASQIVLAAITLTTLALKFEEFNQWEDFNSKSNDAGLVKVCHSLLALAVREDSVPSSFKLKYINESKNSCDKILKALQNYFIQLQVEQFYQSQEFKNVAPTYEKRNDYNEKRIQDEIDARIHATGQSTNHSFASNPSIASSHSAVTPPSRASSSASPFASPFMAHDFISSPDSLPTPFYDKNMPFFPRTQASNTALLPLTPTTPTLLKNKMAAIKRRSMTLQIRNPSLQLTRSNTDETQSFMKGHRKRASSSMDIDFFEDEVAIKR
ncbi:hypothetical protein HG537_0F04800 [Torulaspora globosa]|uniref:Cyclin-like domain-containing protein n=1 Tax=Torulaspora globosa TaxID=48254 RepID=A0A7H9HWS0_9SACH|nr:hypothetical protein HG537_0F04800 [Torulaspora sp. CBS 2947]